jgi:hypothetical protein
MAGRRFVKGGDRPARDSDEKGKGGGFSNLRFDVPFFGHFFCFPIFFVHFAHPGGGPDGVAETWRMNSSFDVGKGRSAGRILPVENQGKIMTCWVCP